MSDRRSPATLSQLTATHLQDAATSWTEVGRRASGFSSSTPWETIVLGRRYPSKAIVALAHELAGFGILNNETLSGKAARARLMALGFTCAKKGEAEYRLQTADVEAGAASIRDDPRAFADKQISHKLHETAWRIGIGDLWYNPRALRFQAYYLAGHPVRDSWPTPAEFDVFLAQIRELGYVVKRGKTPRRAMDSSWKPGELREAAAHLVGASLGPVKAKTDEEIDPLQVVFGETAYSATALFGDQRLDIEAIQEDGGILRTTPDLVDEELDRIANEEGLSTEVRRSVLARIGQGRFREALLFLHQCCVVTGISQPAALRAAHIHRWADCKDTPDARLDPENGLLLSANLDCLFEAGLISFNDEGQLLISPRLNSRDYQSFGLHSGMRLKKVPSVKMRSYLDKHRNRWPDAFSPA